MAHAPKKPGKPASTLKERFPLRGPGYRLICDGAPLDDGTFTVRILIAGIRTPSDARKAATWLQSLITARMPKSFRTANGMLDEGETRQ